ncbi:MAG: type II toxin-antitoxin system RatA family toxin [Bauldia sp.]
MFALVADVESYPQFVPLCTGMKVRSRTFDGEREIVLAKMTVAYGFLRESFTSKVTLDRNARRITAAALDGPFRLLDNIWAFEALGERRTRIDFSLSYEFRSRALGLIVGAVFDRAFRRYVEAFKARADSVFGATPAPAAGSSTAAPPGQPLA